MKMKRLVAAGLAVTMAVSLVGCSGSKEEDTKTKDGKIVISAITTANEDQKDVDPIVKTWYESWDRFLKDHPEVEHMEYVPHDAYQEKHRFLHRR